MIITQKKPIEELLSMLEGVKKVAIVGCGNCAAACQTGGEKEVLEMKTYLDKEYVYYPEYDLYAGSNLFVVMHDQSEKLVVYFPIEE